MSPLQSKPRTSAVTIVAGLALSVAQGCSVAAVGAAPRDARAVERGEPVQLCTRRGALPYLDLFGVAAGAALVGLGAAHDSSVPTALGAGMAATFGASAVFGFSTAPGCVPAEQDDAGGVASR
jgi:hypothetical protein